MKIIDSFKAHPAFISLISIVAFYTINNYIWLTLDAPFPTFFYYAFDFLRAIELYDLLNKFRLDLVVDQLFYCNNVYIHSLATALIAFIVNKSNTALILLSNIPYFALALFSIYMIGRKISDKATGLLAVVIFSLYPAIYGISRLYVIEFAVMAAVPLCVLCLLNTEGFTNRRYCLLFGLALGWGMVIKYEPIVFVIGPLAYVLIRALISVRRDKPVKKSPIILNIGISVLAAAAVMGIKYFNLINIRNYLSRPFNSALPGAPWYKFENLRVYTLGLFEYQLSLFFLFILLLGAIGLFLKAKRNIIIILLSWIIVPWLILVTMPCSFKSTHYIIPYLPAMALVSAIGINGILVNNRKLRIGLIGLILIIGIIQYYNFSFGLWPGLDNFKVKTKKFGYIHYYKLSEDVCDYPKKEGIYNEVVSSITKRSGGRSKVVMLPSALTFSYASPYVWTCFTWFRDQPFEITAFDTNLQFIDNVLKGLVKADFIIYAGNGDIKEEPYLNYILEKIVELHKKTLDNDGLIRANQFLEQKYQVFRSNFYELLSKFDLVETIPYKEAHFRIYKKSE